MHERTEYSTAALFFVAGSLAGAAERAGRRGEEPSASPGTRTIPAGFLPVSAN